MARKRWIAPGFFKNEDLGECSPLARLLFAGLWCWADREGRLEDRPRRLRAEILPYDSADGEALVAELAAHGFVERYEVNGVKVLQILHFEAYQDPHPREATSILPDRDGNLPDPGQGQPKANPGRTLGEPGEEPSPARPSRPSRPSHSLDQLASLAGGRAGAKGVGLGPLGSEVVAAVSAGLGFALRPLTLQADADEFEERVALFAGGVEEAVQFFASTCRNRQAKPEGVKVLLLMLRDLTGGQAKGVA